MKKVLVNYNFTPDPSWIGDDYLIYDRSDDGVDHLKEFDHKKIIRTENRGNVDYDKLSYLIDVYPDLPEVFLWGKTNLFKYITEDEYKKVKDNTTFTPLLTQDHKTYGDHLGAICYYSSGMYHERQDNWFVNELPYHIPTLRDFTDYLQIPPIPGYIPFAPGGNYILTRHVVHRYSVDLYKKMRDTLPYTQLPAEAHFCERLYYTLWK